jgi:hypothetical protein
LVFLSLSSDTGPVEEDLGAEIENRPEAGLSLQWLETKEILESRICGSDFQQRVSCVDYN